MKDAIWQVNYLVSKEIQNVIREWAKLFGNFIIKENVSDSVQWKDT